MGIIAIEYLHRSLKKRYRAAWLRDANRELEDIALQIDSHAINLQFLAALLKLRRFIEIGLKMRLFEMNKAYKEDMSLSALANKAQENQILTKSDVLFIRRFQEAESHFFPSFPGPRYSDKELEKLLKASKNIRAKLLQVL